MKNFGAIYWLFLVLLTGLSCRSTRHSTADFRKHLQHEIENSPVFANSFSGFLLQDAETGAVLCESNADRLFTPASNTKILTFALAMHLLGDTLPHLEYAAVGNSFYFQGVGDPTFLHPKFEAWQAGIKFLAAQHTDSLNYYERPFEALRFGSGWMWDDYNGQYQAERSVLPLYGNTIWVTPGNGNDLKVTPRWFAPMLSPANTGVGISGINRLEDQNQWTYAPRTIQDEESVPFRTTVTAALLSDTLHRSVFEKKQPFSPFDSLGKPKWHRLAACPTDTVYRHLMYHSDNLFAEQLLLMCAQKKIGTFDSEKMIAYAIDSIFPPTLKRPRWEDGSGLSRYNLVAPRYLTAVLAQMYQTYPYDYLCSFFPAGGNRGTISEWYCNPKGQPYVFAKTGSMSGVICLSGYLTTKKGKRLIFSFMHNNFVGSNRPWKEEMQRILFQIYNMPN